MYKPFVLTFNEDLDLAYRPELRSALQRAVEEPAVILDLSEVSYMDSTAIAELIIFYKQRDCKGVAIVVSPSIDKLLSISGLNRLFATYASLEDAVANVGRSGEPRGLQTSA